MSIEPQVFDLLLYLIENRDRVVTRDELFRNLWAGKAVVDASLSRCMKMVRKVVGDTGLAQQIIRTVHGRGYQFIGSVSGSMNGNLDPDMSVGDQPRGLNEHGAQNDKPSILVRPFVTQGDLLDDEYFAVGVTDEIRLDLCRFRNIIVVARESSMELKDTDPLQAARHLSSDFVLEGTIQRKGNQIRISARLLNTVTEQQVWAERYDRELSDTFEIQDELSQQIVTMLIGKIESDSRQQALRKPVADLNAYDFLLRGNYYFNDWHASEDEVAMAEEMYTKASELAPESAEAFIGLASVHVHRIDRGFTNSLVDSGKAAIRFARKAVELDKHNSSARFALAIAYFYGQSNYDQAMEQLKIALELNPNDYHSYCFGGWICMCSGDLGEGMRCSHEAIRRNPLLPDDCLSTIGTTEYLLGQYGEAIEAFSRMLKPDPWVNGCMAACYAQSGETQKAAVLAKSFLKEVETDPGTEVVRSRDYWESVFDFKDPSRLDHLIDGLRKAELIE